MSWKRLMSTIATPTCMWQRHQPRLQSSNEGHRTESSVLPKEASTRVVRLPAVTHKVVSRLPMSSMRRVPVRHGYVEHMHC
jgi:hypothetical protein